ncbi:MAG: trypsin-like peptidase domain-containing protein [Ilumatobacteraceae bacterium]
MTSLPPPPPGVSPSGPPIALPGPPVRPTPPERSSTRRGVLLIAVVAVVAWVAGLTGALVGSRVSDWLDSPPKSASDEPINVSDPRGPIEGLLDVAAVIEHMAPSVVTISADVGGGQSIGTGVIITGDGEILTNAHVVEGATTVRVRLSGETEPREANLLASDAGNDLALLRMNGDGFAAATFADPGSVRLGDQVVAIGFALGLDGDPSVTLGIVSALDRTIGTDDAYLDGLLQTDAAISSGNSGGPLVNAAGEVVGINTAVARDTATSAATNVGFAISAGEAIPVIEALRAQAGGEERIEGYLGVELGERRDGGQGAVIGAVQDGTPAARAGIEADDLVIAADGATIDGATGLIATIRDLGPGDSTTLTVVREGERIDITVTLTERPPVDD